MKPLIYRHTTFHKQREVTTLYVFGVPVFRTVYIDKDDTKHKAIGFNVYASEAPAVDDTEDDYDDDADEDEQFIILPYGKED